MINFKVIDRLFTLFTLIVKFIKSFLPGARKPYNLKPVFQLEMDIHGTASKAVVYNIAVSPKTIEEGLEYRLVVNTWSSVKSNGHILKKMRGIRSDFTVTAVKG